MASQYERNDYTVRERVEFPIESCSAMEIEKEVGD
jgi:hypothetical protein